MKRQAVQTHQKSPNRVLCRTLPLIRLLSLHNRGDQRLICRLPFRREPAPLEAQVIRDDDAFYAGPGSLRPKCRRLWDRWIPLRGYGRKNHFRCPVAHLPPEIVPPAVADRLPHKVILPCLDVLGRRRNQWVRNGLLTLSPLLLRRSSPLSRLRTSPDGHGRLTTGYHLDAARRRVLVVHWTHAPTTCLRTLAIVACPLR